MLYFPFAGAIFLVFNVPVILLLVRLPFVRQMKHALQEKDCAGGGTGATSYSRVTGALGAVMLTTFFWAIGNLVLADALFFDGAFVPPLLGSIDHFFLVGSALFLPYAFNQLKSLFPWGAAAGAAIGNTRAPQAVYTAPVPAGAPMHVTIGNLTDIDSATMQHTVAAIQFQVDQHFAKEWGCTATLVTRRMAPSDVAATLAGRTDAVIYLAAQVQDPLSGLEQIIGIHRSVGDNKPYGFVYLDKCIEFREKWSVTLSHEVLELLVDPTAVLTVDDASMGATPGSKVALEVCDPVQGTAYTIGDVDVANFVNRVFFGMLGKATDMNYLGIAQEPCMALPTGYVQCTDSTGYSFPRWGGSVTPGAQAARLALKPYRRNDRRTARSLRAARLDATPKKTHQSGETT